MLAYRRLLTFFSMGLFLLASGGAYTVPEGYKALLLYLGGLKTDQNKQPIIKGPGLHFTLPVLVQVKQLDTRLQTFSIQSSRIMTAEQKDVLVDYYVKWRINNLALFYTRTGNNLFQAKLLLEQQLNDGLRAEFGRRKINEVIADDRTHIMQILNKQANTNAQKLGITIVDVRIKRIDLPAEVSMAVFARMRAERGRVATEHRSAGKANAEAICAQADANAAITLAQAKQIAARMRSLGDAQAAKIYAGAYQQDPLFFAFLRSLEAYKNSFNQDNTSLLVLTPRSEFFKYFLKGDVLKNG